MATATKTKTTETIAHTPEVEAILAHTQDDDQAHAEGEQWESPQTTVSEPTSEIKGSGSIEEVAPLTGTELINLVQSCGANVPRDELIKLAGYTKVDKNGTTRLMYAAFMEAVLEAQGTKLGTTPSAAPGERGKMGHPLSYVTRIHFNGNIMVGKAYVHMLDAHEKGKPFKVIVNPESNPGGINLVPLTSEEAEGVTNNETED